MASFTKESLIWFMLFIIYYISVNSRAANRITRGGGPITDGEIIVSNGGKFVLGFFSPGNSTSRYAGIWYNQTSSPEKSVIWVANRETPVLDEGGVIRIGDDGNLMVVNGNGETLWTTNLTLKSNNSAAVLMDSGDLKLYENSRESVPASWESFTNPTDTFLPELRVYMDIPAGEQHVFSSWKSPNDPARGNYTMGIDARGSPQIVIWNGINRVWRSGFWTGAIFTGIPTMRAAFLYGFKLNNDPLRNNEPYFTYTPPNPSELLKFRVSWDGYGEQEKWVEGLNIWNISQKQPDNECDKYNRCGPFAKCDILNTPICTCLEGFIPDSSNSSNGCVRNAKLQCEVNNTSTNGDGNDGNEKKDGFLKIEGVKLPDFVANVGIEDINQCEEKCLNNCSCVAYAYVTGINCMIWTRELIDIQQFTENGDTLYFRVAHSELGGGGTKSKLIIVVVVVVVVVVIFLLSFLIWMLYRRKAKSKAAETQAIQKKKNEVAKQEAGISGGYSTECSGPIDLTVEGEQRSGQELPLYNFSVVALATNDFSHANELGEGGFGIVYKGVLPCGQTIAVKRLSRKSGQGIEEFKNEIKLIARLQHRNLVRLLGCTIEGEEKMLIYEYMPNKSLDSILFDSAKQSELDWTKRFNIIEGIARGLLYLHRDSRLRIIHRDLKASNILLDEEMNPKISDFGMARMFGGNQNEANTMRVVGTFGYMAHEYAMEGLFSVKSDVYSFGILLLEIISGKRNTHYRSAEYANIKGYAWDLWDKAKAMELIDPSIASTCKEDEVQRCIHIGMLCVQDSATHRPDMASVVLMLESANTSLPMPRQPTFTSTRMTSIDEDMWHVSHEIASSNNVTITSMIGR